MKLLLNNGITILIREEDFLEVGIGQEEISYTRPNGSKASIKFADANLGTKRNNVGGSLQIMRETIQRGKTEHKWQSSMTGLRHGQSQRDEESSLGSMEKPNELETKRSLSKTELVASQEISDSIT